MKYGNGLKARADNQGCFTFVRFLPRTAIYGELKWIILTKSQ